MFAKFRSFTNTMHLSASLLAQNRPECIMRVKGELDVLRSAEVVSWLLLQLSDWLDDAGGFALIGCVCGSREAVLRFICRMIDIIY